MSRLDWGAREGGQRQLGLALALLLGASWAGGLAAAAPCLAAAAFVPAAWCGLSFYHSHYCACFSRSGGHF